jgi:hypothetical protein
MKKFICFALSLIAVAISVPLASCSKKENENTSKYNIEVAFDDEANTLKGTVDFTYYNDGGNEINELKFNLWGNAYRQDASYKPISDAYYSKAYYKGASYGQMQIENVENCTSWDVGGEDENILCVNLLTPAYPEDTTHIKITYTLSLANVNHRTGVTSNTINLGNFYPVLCYISEEGFVETPYYFCGDPFVSECADYTVTLTMPSKYTAATSGNIISENTAGENKICKYALNSARDFAIVLSDKFQTATTKVDSTTVTYYYYDDANPQTALNAAADSLDYFSQSFGQYVYPTMSVVQTGFCMGGMEYPALTMISDSLDSAAAIYTIVHENAHQWWYAMVGSDQVNHSWQDEGLAEYSSLMFFEKNPTYGLTRTGMVGAATKSYRAFYSVYNQLFGDADTTMDRCLNEFIGEYEYSNIAYNKGLLLFEAVRSAVGDEKFATALKTYFKDNLFKVASPQSLYAPFAKGADIEGIFTSFVDGKIII